MGGRRRRGHRRAGWDEGVIELLEKLRAETGQMVRYVYLRDPEGALVATWDEGRWWTPEEARAFQMMGLVPATYLMATCGSMNRAERRRRGLR